MASTTVGFAFAYEFREHLDALVGPASTFPLIAAIPPSTENAAADCLSVMFDAEEFRLYLSPHILTNTARVLGQLGLSDALAEDYIEAILDITAESGGQVIDPPRTVFDVHDYEDDLVLDLVVATDSLILVTDDTDLTELNPWNGRLILRPRDFVDRVVQSRRR
jgi:predicted nucleic acid-binding protein